MNRTKLSAISIGFILVLFLGCGSQFDEIKEEINQEFGDSHFTTSIALIELHKIRYGEYPKRLINIKFQGDWDKIALMNVKYKRLPQGYQLDLKRGYIGMPDSLFYPDEFWQGLGCLESNLKPSNHE